jgi:hypothetical protein
MMDQAELMLLVEQQEGQQQRLLSMQEALHMMVGGVGSWSAIVYSRKRHGNSARLLNGCLMQK